jgi:hypothetical protein
VPTGLRAHPSPGPPPLRRRRAPVESILPQMSCMHVLLHEDNTTVVAALAKLTSRCLVMMTELRRLCFMLDTNDIYIRPRFIRSAANVWADTLSRELDKEDWQLNPRLFAHLQARWGPHSIDRFVSMLNTQLPRFNARWRDPQCEDVDYLRMPDAAWRRENNYCNPPRTALPALAAKLGQSQAPATVVARYWPNKTWYHAMQRLATATDHFPTSRYMFFPGRLSTREGVGPPASSIVVFWLTPPPRSTPDARSHRQSATPHPVVLYIATDCPPRNGPLRYRL